MKKISYFTSESVMAGHPDKMCDQISDAILDAIIAKDSKAHVACETVATEGLIMVTGEITANTTVDYEKIIRKTVNDIGYCNDLYGFNGNTCKVLLALKKQSPDIARGVETDKVTGAGDQGMMFGYACNETEQLMPLSITLAHKLVKKLDEYRRTVPEQLGPDGKAQVTVEYEDGKVKKVDTIVVSVQHVAKLTLEECKTMVTEYVIKQVIPKEMLKSDTKIYINPTGRFVEGGPTADAGLTGRKIVVDTYGGYASHGGGAFSGKDPTKVDRTGAYMARYIAKNLVAAGLADKCQIELAYSIGKEEPVSIHIDSFGTSKLEEEDLVKIVRKEFPLTPAGMIEELDLRKPVYQKAASYGHFGRDEVEGFHWERTDKVDKLKKYCK
ncbi:methionine adenosyltransferase [[Clostridium] polysaccharolyticum]|uniref:S-adenosylmethionine synthase n=1 Tax=[Clostridium] polysaccharolyticum TaxID=29364 RepID=A0A1H9ZB43_9FIRM|nr:methionine adenosyltransferase [[Clostridium] polysaccharolyticum]SES78290.1 methionine adenosyltransferase [[Clostridium] polysaccharolyticum]